MTAESHIGEAAELYALGALDGTERAIVDAHIATCAECLRRVGEAEETVLALERATIPPEFTARKRGVVPFERRGISAWWIPIAAAAALVIGLLIPRGGSNQHDLAMVAMLHSHFSHAQFAGAQNAPPAKVLYARDRSWYYILVEGRHDYEVYGLRGGVGTDLGMTRPRETTSELFLRSGGAFDRIELRENGTAVEAATVR